VPQVSLALLTPAGEVTRSALNESAAYYVYAWIKSQFEDVDLGIDVWGDLILDGEKC
jgi:hypothetical protein